MSRLSAVVLLLSALCAAQQATDPLIQLLKSKGVLTDQEVASLESGVPPQSEQRHRLVDLLRAKGILTEADVRSLEPAERPLLASTTPMAVPMVAHTQPQPLPQARPPAEAPAQPAPQAPAVIAAIAPLRMLPIDPVKRESVAPSLKIGNGVSVKPYGFIKASLVYDTSSPGGNDFPLPGFLADSGPDLSPEFHAKARASRFGFQVEGLDPSPNTTITGRIEADFEGNFSRANNRNISTIRSSMLSLRLAYVRLDHKFSDKTSFYMVAGQDWTPFSSSTLPNVVETTGIGLGFGTLWERSPQARIGITESLGGKSSVKLTPEFAITMPAYGNNPSDVANQLGYGERQGADSGRPEIQARLVTQWQLDHAPAVAPAQLIFSFVQGERRAIVLASAVPSAFHSAFPNGASVSSERIGYTAELQLPTRYITVLSKFYAGSDMRYYFGGQFYSNFNDASGLTGTASASSQDGSSTVIFGLRDGVPTVAPQRPVRAEGGFINLGFPLSRIFDANPKGRNAGWSLFLHYGKDEAFARDARHFAGGRGHSDWSALTIQYKMNSFLTYMYEQSLYRTRAANNSSTDFNGLPLLRGIPSREWQDMRSEFAVLFTF